MPRHDWSEEFDCEDCTEKWPCGQHEAKASEMCEPDPMRTAKGE